MIHPSNNTQTETMIVRHPHNTNVLFASANTFNVGGATGFSCGHYVSTNAGVTWFGDDTTIFNYADAAPMIDKNGIFYIGHITLAGHYGISYSTNYGVTWSSTYTVPNSQMADKGFLFTDDNPNSLYYGRTYSAFTSLFNRNIQTAYTTNNGHSWSSALHGVNPRIWLNKFCLGVDAKCYNGIIYAVWALCLNNGDNSTEDSLGFAKSTNGGDNWTSSYVLNMNGIRTSDLLPQSDVYIRGNGLPRIDIDQNGIIYVVTSEKNFTPALDNADIVLNKSTDQGQTWTRKRVNQCPAGSYEYFGAVRVDEGGAVNICYYSTRNVPTGDSVEVYISRSWNRGETFHDFKISGKSKPVPIVSIQSSYAGDYIGITSTGAGKLVPVWYEKSPQTNGIYQAVSSLVTLPKYEIHHELATVHNDVINFKTDLTEVLKIYNSNLNDFAGTFFHNKAE
jgi:hypothetical protein